MAANEKKPSGFFLYPEHVRAVCAMLRASDAGRLLLALCDYFDSGALPAPRTKAFDACFTLLREDIDRDVARYREVCQRQRALANRRWHPQPPASQAAASHGMPSHAYPTQPYPTQPNTTQPNPAQPGAASAARPDQTYMKGETHDHSSTSLPNSRSTRGTVL